MRIEMEQVDVRAIAKEVHDLLLPQLMALQNGKAEESIMGVAELAEYLGMSEKWIYDQTGGKRIPYFKLGSILKFKKTDIDKWVRTFNVPAVANPTAMKRVIRRRLQLGQGCSPSLTT